VYRKPGLGGVSTALAIIAIILVLILGMSWMVHIGRDPPTSHVSLVMLRW
jgi:hypothetical protein